MDLKELCVHLDLLSDFDKKPVKSRLNSELKEKFLTEKQWLEKGFKPKVGAYAYLMHPSSLNKKTCAYYFVDDVETCSLETCVFCCYYKNRFCVVAGDFVSVCHHCSEFERRTSQ